MFQIRDTDAKLTLTACPVAGMFKPGKHTEKGPAMFQIRDTDAKLTLTLDIDPRVRAIRGSWRTACSMS